jgi:hypothetical protein
MKYFAHTGVGLSLMALFLMQPQTASAGVILSPTSVVLNTAGNFSSADPIENTINQAGMDTPFTSGVTDFDTYMAGNPLHNYGYTTEWFSPTGVYSGTIIYDLGADYSLSQMALWNEDASGLATVSMYTCPDSACSTSTFIGTFDPTPNTYGVDYPAQVVPFVGTTEYVELFVTGPGPNDGWDGLAMGEVAFDTSSVPEPSTFLLLGGGLAAVIWRRARRKAVC